MTLIANESAAGFAPSGLSLVCIYGVNLASQFPLTFPMLAASGSPHLTVLTVDEPPCGDRWRQAQPAYRSPIHTQAEQSALCLYRLGECDLLHFPDTADFYVYPDRILLHITNPGDPSLVEIRLLGLVLSYWLELQGVPTLHASAVDVHNRAIAFLSSSYGGKTSLAASLMQVDFPLITDDVLPLEQRGGIILARPAYPAMRMWPNEAQHFIGKSGRLETVLPYISKLRVPVGENGFGVFCTSTLPLARIYLPQQRDPAQWGIDIAITPLSQQMALLLLLKYSFVPHLAWAARLAPQRLDFLAKLTCKIPVCRLVYPSGLEHLPAVRDAILADLSLSTP